MPPRMCAGQNRDGAPCGAGVPPGATLCVHHDPAHAEEMARRRAKGNASRSRTATTAKAAEEHGVPNAPTTLQDIASYYSWVTDAMARGRIDARVGHEICFALRG